MSYDAPLDDQYFEWLYAQVGTIKNRNPRRSHWQLARVLHQTEFEHFVPNDDNRAVEGKDLRREFMNQLVYDVYEPEWEALECSMFEMLLGIARRAEFLADPGTLDGEVAGWFWKILSNLGLDKYTDYNINRGLVSLEEAAYKLERVNRRLYERNGQGGLFPLIKEHREDQRKVELWYQLNLYLLDHGFVDPIPDDLF